MKRALITGITGQDGSYLAELLYSKGYKIYGMYRRTSIDVFDRIKDLKDKLELVQGDLGDAASIIRVLKETQPEEVYNLGAQSFVPASWTQPEATAQMTALGALRVLEAIRLVDPKIKFYQASSSEMFGQVAESPQDENTRFHPRSPYGVSKVFAYWTTINYRESYNIFACNGILFNHESPRRGKQFVTRKITHSVAKIKLGMQQYLELGNLNAKRDWGFAGDYVKAMRLMLQQEKPDDFVIGTGKMHSVREFCDAAFKEVGMEIEWQGKGVKETGFCDGKTVVRINPKFFRPAEVNQLLANPAKANQKLGWTPKVSFNELVKMMVRYDLDILSER
ncbi:GDP-mannose 4,6-dehydratase [Candidatus Woesearchaeota archaeon]|nr:GDP-mannose 4,6-dehydratase [Candidatus Woesearchaeota archaeon]